MPRISVVITAHYDSDSDSTQLHTHVSSRGPTEDSSQDVLYHKKDAELLWDQGHVASVQIAAQRALSRWAEYLDMAGGPY